MMPRAFGLIIAIQQYAANSGLPALPETLKRAKAFHDWLVTVRGVASNDIFFCSKPQLRVSRKYGARRTDIYHAIDDLVDAGKDKSADLFVFCSGHGFGVDRNDVLVAADFDQRDGTTCIRLDELRAYLVRAMGPGTHFWFVEACRNPFSFQVPSLGLQARTSYKGFAEANDLFATAPGARARATSSFSVALVSGLRGEGRAKTWLTGAYWVTFPLVAEVVRTAVQREDMFVDPRAAPRVGRILLLGRVPDSKVTVEVRGALAGESYVLLLSGSDRPLQRFPFTWPHSTFGVPPGDFFPELEFNGEPIQPINPPYASVLDLFADATVTFDKGLSQPASSLVTPMKLVLPTSPSLRYRVSRGHGRRVTEHRATTVLSATRAPMKIELFEGDVAIGHVAFDRQESVPDVVNASDLLPTSGLRPRLLNMLPTRFDASRGLWLDDLEEPAVPADMREPATVFDSDPGLLLALAGAAAICNVQPYSRRLSELTALHSVRDGEASVLVITSEKGGRIALDTTMGSVHLKPLSSLGGTAAHATVTAKPGTHLLRIKIGGLLDASMATVTLRNRVTLVVVASVAGAPRIHQFILPVPRLLGRAQPQLPALPPRVTLLESVVFGALVQRRFSEGIHVRPTKADSHNMELWEHLIRGPWPEPVTPLVAAYELVRRGLVSKGNRSQLSSLLRWLDLRYRGAALPDLNVLKALYRRVEPEASAVPLMLDGLLAATMKAYAPPAGMALDYQGPWTVWRHWPTRSARAN